MARRPKRRGRNATEIATDRGRRQGMDEWRQVQNCALEEGRRQVLKMAKSAVASRIARARARAWPRVVGQTGSVGPSH